MNTADDIMAWYDDDTTSQHTSPISSEIVGAGRVWGWKDGGVIGLQRRRCGKWLGNWVTRSKISANRWKVCNE